MPTPPPAGRSPGSPGGGGVPRRQLARRRSDPGLLIRTSPTSLGDAANVGRKASPLTPSPRRRRAATRTGATSPHASPAAAEEAPDALGPGPRKSTESDRSLRPPSPGDVLAASREHVPLRDKSTPPPPGSAPRAPRLRLEPVPDVGAAGPATVLSPARLWSSNARAAAAATLAITTGTAAAAELAAQEHAAEASAAKVRPGGGRVAQGRWRRADRHAACREGDWGARGRRARTGCASSRKSGTCSLSATSASSSASAGARSSATGPRWPTRSLVRPRAPGARR